MKKYVMILIILLVATVNGFSVDVAARSPAGSRQVKVMGYVSTELSISVKPLNATGMAAKEGMPFNVLGNDVRSDLDVRQGRKIATWSMLSANKVSLTITAAPLKGIYKSPNPDLLNYKLSGYYFYTCQAASNSSSNVKSEGFWSVATNKGAPGSTTVTLDLPSGADPGSRIAINDCVIRVVMGDDAATLNTKADDEYIGTVTFLITSLM